MKTIERVVAVITGGGTATGAEVLGNVSEKITGHDILTIITSVAPAKEVTLMCLVYILFGIMGALGGLVVTEILKPIIRRWLRQYREWCSTDRPVER